MYLVSGRIYPGVHKLSIEHIANVVRSAQYSMATDLEDGVYAILGLLEEDFASEVVADYSFTS